MKEVIGKKNKEQRTEENQRRRGDEKLKEKRGRRK